MKLISIHIYKWQQDNSLLLASIMDVSMLWFYQRGMAKEHLNFNSRLISGRIPPGNKATTSLEDDLGKCHCWTTADGISATVITDADYPDKAAYILLNNVIQDFREYFAADPDVYENAVSDLDGKLPYPNLEGFLRQWQDPHEADKLMKVEKELFEEKFKKQDRKKKKATGPRKEKKPIQLDEEDIELLNENTGIGLRKKNRLKRNADVEKEKKAAAEDTVKKEVEVKTKKDEDDDQMQIDTRQKKALIDDLRREKMDYYRDIYDSRPEDREKQKMAVEIFGESDEEDGVGGAKDALDGTDQHMEEIFNADEIDGDEWFKIWGPLTA